MKGTEICWGIWGVLGRGQLETGTLMKLWDMHGEVAQHYTCRTADDTREAARVSPLCTTSTAQAPESRKAQAPPQNLSNSLHICCSITHSSCLGSPGMWPPEAPVSVWTTRRHKQMTKGLNFQPRQEKASWAEGERMRSCLLRSWWTLSTSIIFYSSNRDGQ